MNPEHTTEDDAAFIERLTSTLSGGDRSELELLQPPHDLWGRIAAAVAAEMAPSAGPGTVVEYVIDADDRVVEVAGHWAEFARQNGAPDLAEPEPRTLWSQLTDNEVRDVWRLLVERVRSEQAVATLPLRCDAPDMRRWYEVTVSAEPDAAVRFRSSLVFEEARETVTLLNTHAEHDESAPPVPVCSWCARGQVGTTWLEIEAVVQELRLLEDVAPSIRQGICPDCRERMSADLLVAQHDD